MRFTHIKCFFTLLWLVEAGLSQTRIDFKNQGKEVDFGNFNYTKPFKMGGGLPTSCTVGELFYLTSAVAGSNVYGCVDVNVWSPQSSALSAGPANTVLTSNGTLTQWLAIGGDLTNTLSSTRVSGLQNRPVSNTAPASGQALIWDGTVWKPQSLAGTLGTVTIESGSTPVGTRGVVNFLAGSGIVNAITDQAGKIVVQQSVNTATVLTRAAFQAGSPLSCAASGTNDVWQCNLEPVLSQYTNMMRVYLNPPADNQTSTVTLAINQNSAVAVKRADGVTDPAPGELKAGQITQLWYDGTVFRMMVDASPVKQSTSAAPTCNAAARGIIWHFFADTGSKDTVEICAKDDTDAYSWRTLY